MFPATLWTEVKKDDAVVGRPMNSAVTGVQHTIAEGDRILTTLDANGAPTFTVVPKEFMSGFTTMPQALPRYAEGSQACRNYSVLTKDLRILAFQLIAGFTIGLALLFKDSPATPEGTPRPDRFGDLLWPLSLALWLFAVALMFVNTHYATAFLFIRDSLARMEGTKGPWSSHKAARNDRDEVAYAAPFIAMALVAIVGVGVSKLGWLSAVGLLLLSAIGGAFWFGGMRGRSATSNKGHW